MKKIFFLWCAFYSLLPAFSQPVNLGAAADYGVLGLPSTSLNFSNVTVNGKVGVSQNGSLSIGGPSVINGNLFVNTGATYSNNGTINGTIYTNQNISQAWTDAINAANTAAALTPTQSFANWSSTLTINGNGGTNVINVGNVNLGSGNYITLNGGANDLWIINVTGSFSMGGDASIKGGGSTTPSQILINIVGTGSTITTMVTNTLQGSILALNRSASMHSVSGQLIIGGSTVSLQSGATVNFYQSVLKTKACNSNTITSNFNGTSIIAGNYIWLNSHIKLVNKPNVSAGPFTVGITGSQISFSANGYNYLLDVPSATITFSNSVSVPTTVYNSSNNTFSTTIPLNSVTNDEIFLTGIAFPVPAGGLPGGINNVSWSGNFTNNITGVSLQWQWGAAVYSQFNTNYNSVGIELLHNTNHAGTPDNYINNVTGGARGGGGSNYTGSWSATNSAMPCAVGSIGKYVWKDVNNDGKANDGKQNGINGQTVELWSPGQDGVIGGTDDTLLSTAVTDTAANGDPGYYLFSNLSSGNYYLGFPKTSGSLSLTNPYNPDISDPDTLVYSVANVNSGYSSIITIDVNGTGNARNNMKINSGYTPANSILAVKLLSFTGIRRNQESLLNWEVASMDDNFDHFELLYSTDGNNFSNIANIPRNVSLSSYSFTHKSVLSNICYYRLKMVDKNGSFTYSDIIVLKRTDVNIEVDHVYPNPFANELTISIGSEVDTKATIYLLDMQGRQIRQLPISISRGSNTISLQNLQVLGAGMYMLSVKSDLFEFSTRVMKKNK